MAAMSDFRDNKFWHEFAGDFFIRPDSIYLNHGSFGPSPLAVRIARRKWIDRLDQQPMDFYVRQLEEHLDEARKKTAEFVGTIVDNLVFVECATYGMNVVAESFPLHAGDEVLLNNHEYGAVHRIWDRRCQRRGANKTSVRLPDRFESKQQIVEALLAGATEHTKLLVVSHITSPTALIMPVQEICEAFRQRGIAVCIDGPHAPAQVPLNIDQLDCDFYTASCHKWLCAPLGSGFLYAHPRWQEYMEPIVKSWGRLLPTVPQRWDEEFTWSGTRDPSPFLTIPNAIEYLEKLGLDNFRGRTRWLATYAEEEISKAFETTPMASRSDGWYGSMAHVPLPAGDWSELQRGLWQQLGIEVPIIEFESKWYVRVSCHLYNSTRQIDALLMTMLTLMGKEREVLVRSWR
jgi:isopenicillin-N epimerase